MGVNGIGGLHQRHITLLSSGPVAVQRIEAADPSRERDRAAEEAERRTDHTAEGGNATATRGRLLNITV